MFSVFNFITGKGYFIVYRRNHVDSSCKSEFFEEESNPKNDVVVNMIVTNMTNIEYRGNKKHLKRSKIVVRMKILPILGEFVKPT